MTKHTPTTLALLVAASAFAQTAPTPAPAWTQTSNLAVSTDYVFRGVSQIANSNAMAFSGGTDIAHSSGLAAGVWFSNQNINDDPPAAPTDRISTLEADIYASYTFKVGSADLSAGVITYNYPSASAYNTIEGNVGVAVSGLSLKYSHAFTDYFGVTGTDGTGYLDLAYTYTVKDLTLGLHYGWTFGSGAQADYEDYKVSLSYPVLGYTLGVAFTDSNAGIFAPAYNNKQLDDGIVVVSLSKTF
jgi:uncharacterized protein (TIGR02001 family)